MKIFVVLLFAMSSSVLAAQEHAAKDLSPNELGSFVERLEALREQASIPGMSVAVIKNQKLLLAEGFGYANVRERIPASADTPFNIASVTKPLSAVVALSLVEAGVLDLDQAITEFSDWEDFCTEFSEQPSIFARALRCQPTTHTLRQLMSHTATGEPGTAFSYNPILYSWASRPIVTVADEGFSSLVDQLVFAPAGMQDSARQHRDLPLKERLAERLAPPYHIDETGTVLPSPMPPPQGDGAAGGVISTVLDLAKFDIALDRGELISERSRTEMMTATASKNGGTFPYGMGWYVQEYEELTLVWHSGWWEDAYSALYLKIPTLELSFIILANSEGLWWDNPLDQAQVQGSIFAQEFLQTFTLELNKDSQ